MTGAHSLVPPLGRGRSSCGCFPLLKTRSKAANPFGNPARCHFPFALGYAVVEKWNCLAGGKALACGADHLGPIIRLVASEWYGLVVFWFRSRCIEFVSLYLPRFFCILAKRRAAAAVEDIPVRFFCGVLSPRVLSSGVRSIFSSHRI